MYIRQFSSRSFYNRHIYMQFRIVHLFTCIAKCLACMFSSKEISIKIEYVSNCHTHECRCKVFMLT